MAQIDIPAIEDQIKTILDNQNSVSGSPVDLSASLGTRVKKVATLNPSAIPTYAHIYPLVSIWCESKDTENTTILNGVQNGKRNATLRFRVFGFVANNSFDDDLKDEADRDVKYLMENIEEILRSNDDIGALLNGHTVEGVEYFNLEGEETIFKAGILTLEGRVYY